MAEEKETRGAQSNPETAEREQVYQEYQKLSGTAPEEAVEQEGQEPQKTKEETAPVEEKKEVQETKSDKYVPYEALHAERMKRKAEAEARKAAEDRARLFEAQISKLSNKDVEDEAPISDYDAEIINLRKQLKALKLIEEDRFEKEKQQNIQRQYEEVQRRIADTDKSLEEEGYPGFSYSSAAVSRKLEEIRMRDEDLAFAMDNPAGWSKIYKEEIFPAMAEKIAKAKKLAVVEDKKDLKRSANLSTVVGKQTPKEKTPEDMSPEELRKEYMKIRRQGLAW